MFESVKIHEICTWSKGLAITRDNTSVDKEIPYLHYGDLYKLYDFRLDIEECKENIIKIDPSEDFSPEQFLKDGDIVFALTSETVDDLGHCTLILNPNDTPFITGMETTLFHIIDRERVVPAYLNYLFQTSLFQRSLRQYVTGMKVYRVHPRDIMNMTISLPDVSTQLRIVSILDHLSNKINLASAINDNLGGAAVAS